VRDLLGGAPLPLRPGGAFTEALEDASAAVAEAPDFDTMIHSAMAEDAEVKPSEIDPDYADLDEEWRLEA
jgi:hypothetical protein